MKNKLLSKEKEQSLGPLVKKPSELHKPSTFVSVFSIGVCSSNSLATRWDTTNLIYILGFILRLLLVNVYSSNSPYTPLFVLTELVK